MQPVSKIRSTKAVTAEVVDISIFRNLKAMHLLEAADSCEDSIPRARLALIQVQEIIDQLQRDELEPRAQQLLGQVQIFIHEASVVITDE